MVTKRVREITIEIENHKITQRQQSIMASYCSSCSENSRLVTFRDGLDITQLQPGDFIDLIDKRDIHVILRTDQTPMICLNSVLRNSWFSSSPDIDFNETQPLGIPKPVTSPKP